MTRAADPAAAAQLQHLTRQLVLSLMDYYTHEQLPGACARFGLPAPPPEAVPPATLTKRQRLTQVFTQIPAGDYRQVLARFIEDGQLPPDTRNQAQDLVWTPGPEILERVRREIADALESVAPIWSNLSGYLQLLRRLFALDRNTGLWGSTTLEAEIVQHTVTNSEDWTVLDLFEAIGALDTHDRRFAALVEGLLSGSVNPDERRQHELLAVIKPVLKHGGLQVIENGSRGGYPEFKILAGNSPGRPAQLVLFASTGSSKPDLRISEVLDRTVEIVDTRQVLRYDRAVPAEHGLNWAALQAWWADTNSLDRVAPDTKKSLYQRLLAGIPKTSPPQQRLFRAYHQWVAAQGLVDFPVLLPEVWLHWDPQSTRQRGDQVFRSHRLDFLLLLPGHRRVVLEVDGAQHYSTADRQASPELYAATMRADRDLRLDGYEVFRFGGHEFGASEAVLTTAEFFGRLLRAETGEV